MSSRFCPTCGRANLGKTPTPETGETNVMSPTMTGEFAAVRERETEETEIGTEIETETATEAARVTEETPAVPTSMPYAGSDRCSWCGKAATEVKKLITGPGVQICDGCVKFCALILRDEDV
jgi:hypothetical protein